MPEAPAEQDQPTLESPEAPETDQPTGGEEEFNIDSFDPTQVPEDADREWFAERVQKLRGDYTKKTQAIAEERREAEQLRQLRDAIANPQVAPAVLAQLGYTEKQVLEMFGYQPEEESEEFDDPDERIDRLEQTLAQREQAEQAERYEEEVTDFISGEIEKLEQKAGREFDASAHKLLDAYARQYAQNGTPDVAGAYELLSGISKAEQKALLDPKRDTPRPPGGGKAATRTVELSKESREERLERMADAVDAAKASAA